jgi:hypothetical protein
VSLLILLDCNYSTIVESVTVESGVAETDTSLTDVETESITGTSSVAVFDEQALKVTTAKINNNFFIFFFFLLMLFLYYTTKPHILVNARLNISLPRRRLMKRNAWRWADSNCRPF